ncbi:hypothetical protein [Bradyrhizobium sp. Leo121]|uniref:hypothetical protein n=1 Tax=Bradyrhizobium sp. Leo121 TaxID=1571195 RepID=UPI001FE1967A|nr:hypothetical protein [Bradyrhizobium sp. Leo121]
MRFFQEEMHWETIARVGVPKQAEHHAREYGADQLNHLIFHGVHIDYDDLRRLGVSTILGL